MHPPLRILLVDDNPYFLEAARDFLSAQEGLTVVGAATHADEALAQAQRLTPDVILLDLNLGNRFGLELIPRFKEKLPQTRIIVLTLMNEAAYGAAARQAGADDFVPKAALSERLMPALRRLMSPA